MPNKRIPVKIKVRGRAVRVCCKRAACSWCGEPFDTDDTAVILPNGQVLHVSCDVKRQAFLKLQKPPDLR